VRELDYTAMGWLHGQDPGAWAIYVACKYNPDRHKAIAEHATKRQRDLIREAYEASDGRRG